MKQRKINISNFVKTNFILLTFIFCYANINAQEVDNNSPEDVAKKLANPVAAMISVPFQNNMDLGIGEYNGSRNILNFQPVLPFSISEKYNLITRLVLPIVYQTNIYGANNSQSGLSDASISAFFSPVEAINGLILGYGPIFLVPTATDDLLASKKFGVGPTFLALKQANGWTYGALLNQLWSVAGDKDRSDVSQFYANPFIVYNWKTGSGLALTADITQNWITSKTVVYTQLMATAVTKMGSQTVSFAIGPRIQIAGDDKSSFGIRSVITFVFPK